MAESVKKYTPGSNLAAMSPEERASAEAFLNGMGQILAENLKRNLMEKDRKEKQEEQDKKGKD